MQDCEVLGQEWRRGVISDHHASSPDGRSAGNAATRHWYPTPHERRDNPGRRRIARNGAISRPAGVHGRPILAGMSRTTSGRRCLRTWHRVEVRSLSKGPGAPRAELSSALRIVWSRLRVIKREVGISGPLCRHATVYVPLAVAHTAHAHCSLPMSAACMPGPHAWPRTLAPRMTATHELA